MFTQLNLKAITLGSPGEDISKKDLLTVIQRFKNLHLHQLKRIQSFLQPRQSCFLNLLPLLFHQNTPLLPGFISKETPSGISDYTPSRQALKDAAQLSKNFKLNNKLRSRYAIWSIFLMGSVSSIAFSKTSDMDIWLCHDPELSHDELEELQQKCLAIEEWATSLGLEVHFFLIDSVKFKAGQDTPISSESSGTTQHYLLLEEFYRTALYIAGRSPAWWLVPPHQEHQSGYYTQHLIENRFISGHELIDFGSLEAVPAEEFITVTLWHIYKAINSPHKSFLKLLLMECYASEYPKTQWLCSDMKKMIYQGNFRIGDLDPYLLIYEKLETYLGKAQSVERLELARQSLYIKIMGLGEREKDTQKRLHRVEFIKSIAARWHWPPNLITSLSHQQSWNIQKAVREHGMIIRHLSECYRMTVGFAGHYVRADYQHHDDLKLIGRKLHAFLDKKPGKIEYLTTRSALQVRENELSLLETSFADNQSGWALHVERISNDSKPKNPPIKKSYSLLEMLAWIIVNGLYEKKIQLHVQSQTLMLQNRELETLTAQIHSFISSVQAPGLDNYKAPDKIIKSLLVVNLGIDPERLRDDGKLILSEHSDPLCYGTEKLCFVHSIDQLSISSWGEMTTQHWYGMDGLLFSFLDIFNNHQLPLKEKDLTVICSGSIRAKSIVQRLQNIFTRLLSLQQNHHADYSPRLIIAGSEQFFIFQFDNQQLNFRTAISRQALLSEFSAPQRSYSPVEIDCEALENTAFPLIFEQNKPGFIQIFFESDKNGIQIYVLDERGSLFMQHHPQANRDGLLNKYQTFIQTVLSRHFFEASIPVEFFEITSKPYQINRYLPKPFDLSSSDKVLNIRVSGEMTGYNARYTIYCNDREFSTLNYGKQVINEAVNYILEFRKSGQSYPIHISDIEVPLATLGITNPGVLQTLHFLKYKQKIEDRINRANLLQAINQ